MAERLQKVMAAAGLGSRRACELIILEGRVRVNGQPVCALPVLVERGDHIEVDGRPIRSEKKVYYLLNKPRGVVCTQRDPAGRTRAVDLVAGIGARVFPVGRLDADSSGLLLLTNDGELAHRLMHPRYEAPKTYEALADGMVSGEELEQLLGGVRLAEGKARADRVRIISRDRQQTRLAITLTEGRNRQIRRMLARLGHKVRRLRRISIGRLTVKGLGIGQYRPLTGDELAYLRRLGGLAGEEPADRRDGGDRGGRRRRPPGRRSDRRSG